MYIVQHMIINFIKFKIFFSLYILHFRISIATVMLIQSVLKVLYICFYSTMKSYYLLFDCIAFLKNGQELIDNVDYYS